MPRHFGLNQLQPGIVRRCERRKKSVDAYRMIEIGFYVVAGGLWMGVWFLFGKEIWRAVG